MFVIVIGEKMSKKNKKLKLTAPEGYRFNGVTAEFFNKDKKKLTGLIAGLEKIEYQLAELKAQCEKDKIDYPEFWSDLWQYQRGDKTWGSPFSYSQMEFDGYKYRRHPHAENIIKWHQCSNADKFRWQYKVNNGTWSDCYLYPDWTADEYRLAPRMIRVTLENGTTLEYPAPVREPLNTGNKYWAVWPDGMAYVRWDNDLADNKNLANGIIHLTEEAAQQHFEVEKAIRNQEPK